MPNFIYKDNIPFSTNNPSNDQPNMLTNTNSIDGIIGIDHFSFNDNRGGTHQQVQLFNTSGVNGAIPAGLQGNGWETLYASATAGNGEIWFVRGATATGIQLTGPGNPIALSQGSTFLPGGLILKWGSGSIPANSTHVNSTRNFASAFPNTCFGVQLTLRALNSGITSTSNTFSILAVSTTQFQFLYNGTNSDNYPNFYYMAIGN